MNYYANNDTEAVKLRRKLMPKIRQFVEAADTSGAGVNKDRPDGIVTGHELYWALKSMFRTIKINMPFGPKDLIREANIHSGPLATSDKERFVDIFSDKIITLHEKSNEYQNIDEIMFNDFAATA